ncbi:MAG: rfaQ [Firmicutes bacterium]|nr:rfaQ [Bacillota bacterium]
MEGWYGLRKELLIIRLSSIGDVIHCTPVVKSLKLAWPDCRITWLVSEASADVIKYNPYIDECWVWSRERFEKYLRSLNFIEAWRMWRELQAMLAKKSFYAVLDIHGLFLTGMIAIQAKAKRRIGLSGAKELNSLFMTETAKPLGRHVTDKYLGVLQALGIDQIDHKMTVVVPTEARETAVSIFGKGGIGENENIAVLIPGTTWSAKNWPPEYFAAVAQALAPDFKFVLGGSRAEISLAEEIALRAGVPMLDICGSTNLIVLAAVIERATVVVTGDTGPLHIAAAVGTPAVAVFGPTNPLYYGPRQGKRSFLQAGLDCSFCHKYRCPKGDAKCMKDVLPAQVVEAVYRITGVRPSERQFEAVGVRQQMPGANNP